jgi:hypothetical protein
VTAIAPDLSDVVTRGAAMLAAVFSVRPAVHDLAQTARMRAPIDLGHSSHLPLKITAGFAATWLPWREMAALGVLVAGSDA